MEINFSQIRIDIKFGHLEKALKDLISLIHEDNFLKIHEILGGIQEIQEAGLNLNPEQFQKIKPFIDSYDENIQEIAINLYTNNILKNNFLLNTEIEFVISKLHDFEPLIREKVTDLLIKVFYDFPEHEKIILSGLINCLRDEIWVIKKKIIEFLNELTLKKPKLIREYDKELEILFDEKDIDVIREILDFLLRLGLETYRIEDIEKLISSIQKREWVAQEKILFLIGKLGIKKKELIEPFRKDLVLLFDFDDFLVNITMVKVIEEIIEYHGDFFDDVFFSFINKDEIDNLEAIEEVLSFSLLKHGFERFNSLFKRLTPLDYQVFATINNVIRKLLKINIELIESCFTQLINDIAQNIDETIYLKLRMILSPNPQYNLFLTCYNALNKLGKLTVEENEKWRMRTIRFVRNTMPELGFLTLNNWLENKLKEGPVKVDDVCNKFHIHRSKLLHILKVLLVKKKIIAIIDNDTINPIEDLKEIQGDLLFLKKWEILRSPKTLDYEIKLYVKIKNKSQDNITDLSIIIDYPSNLFIESEYKDQDKNIPKTLEPDQEFILEWLFQKPNNQILNPKSSSMKVILLYEKQDKLFSIVKKLDILLM